MVIQETKPHPAEVPELAEPTAQPTEPAEPPERDPFWLAAEAALRRAAYKARQRDIALTGSAVTYRDGKIVYDTEP